MIFIPNIQFYTLKMAKWYKLTSFGQRKNWKLFTIAFHLKNNNFVAEDWLHFKKKHHLQLWLIEILYNPQKSSFLVKFVSKIRKKQQKAPKSIICIKTHQMQVIQAQDSSLRPVFNFLNLYSTGPDPLFNLGPNSFIVSTKVNHFSWPH